VVTGLVAVGDSWACTNPTAGRGFSIGLAHAIALRDVLRQRGDDPYQLAVRFHDVTEAKLTPWYRDQIDRDLQRAGEMQAAVEGQSPKDPAGPGRQMQTAFLAAASADADVARGWLEVFACLALPQEVMSRSGIADKVHSFVGSPAPQVPAPSRTELLKLVG
jgi:2-polyprenyl-6-methoxyphenol hydroxylase-like FAD-dependent oxidoreductase